MKRHGAMDHVLRAEVTGTHKLPGSGGRLTAENALSLRHMKLQTHSSLASTICHVCQELSCSLPSPSVDSPSTKHSTCSYRSNPTGITHASFTSLWHSAYLPLRRLLLNQAIDLEANVNRRGLKLIRHISCSPSASHR